MFLTIISLINFCFFAWDCLIQNAYTVLLLFYHKGWDSFVQVFCIVHRNSNSLQYSIPLIQPHYSLLFHSKYPLLCHKQTSPKKSHPQFQEVLMSLSMYLHYKREILCFDFSLSNYHFYSRSKLKVTSSIKIFLHPYS